MKTTSEPAQQKCRCILIIEDEQDIRDTLYQALKMEGYDAWTASNGQEGLEVLKKAPSPCLILLDLMMPIMNGWEFVEALHGDHILCTIPVVVFSAFGDKARTIKSHDFVKKPVDLDTLFNIVQRYCN